MFDQPIQPELFLVRPGDVLRITFLHSSLVPIELTISPDGNIIHPNIGLVETGGLTLAQLRERLVEPLRRQYSAKEVSVTITEPRQVAIAVAGAVEKPGHYRASNSYRVSDLIEMAGGIRSSGSSRRVTLRGGPTPLPVDLDKSMYTGDDISDPFLYAGTRIEVPAKSSDVVQVIGEVLRPREIELMPGDDLALLVALAGGPTRKADLKRAEILGYADRDPHRTEDIRSGDIIRIPALGEGTPAGVAIFGEVKSPGLYLMQDSLTLDQLVKMADGFTTEANQKRVTVFRLAESDAWQMPVQAHYPIDASLMAETGAFHLHPFDSVVVPRRLGWVRVSGLVRSPGLVPYVEGKDAIFYIQAVGGFVQGAETKEVLLFDRVAQIGRSVPPSTAVRDGDEVTAITMDRLQ